MLRIPRLLRNGLSLARSVQICVRKNSANQASSAARPSSEPNTAASSSDLKISELIKKNAEAEAFILERFHILNSNLKIDLLKTRIQSQIKINDPKQVTVKDLKLLAHVGESESDIDLLVEGIKLYLKDEENLRTFRFGPLLMKLLNVLDMTEKAVELFKNKELEPAFRGPASANLLMKKFLHQKDYAKVLEIFELQKSRYTLENLNLRPDLTTKVNQKAQAVPSEHMQSVALALLQMNQTDSCKKAKELIEFAKEKESTISNLALIRLFVLALIQNDLELAQLVVSQFKSSERSTALLLNLTAILKAKQNRLDDAFDTIDLILQSSKDEKLKLNGCLFSDVIKILVESIKKDAKDGDAAAKMDVYKVKLKKVMDKVKAEKRLFRQELHKYCTEKI